MAQTQNSTSNDRELAGLAGAAAQSRKHADPRAGRRDQRVLDHASRDGRGARKALARPHVERDVGTPAPSPISKIAPARHAELSPRLTVTDDKKADPRRWYANQVDKRPDRDDIDTL